MLARLFHDLWRQWLVKTIRDVGAEPAHVGADLPQRLDHSFPRRPTNFVTKALWPKETLTASRVFPSVSWPFTLRTNAWEREDMAKIRHLAIKTKSPERLAAFYEDVFGLKRIRSEKGGAIYMSDGYLTV